jgi:gliding motility-associated lipoprotein GldH
MKTKLTIMLLAAFGLLACNPNQVYKEHKDVNGDMEWPASDQKEFSFEIEDPSATYTLAFSMQHITQYPFRKLVISTGLKNLKGETQSKIYELSVRDGKDDFIGEGAGDYYDFEEVIEKKMKFPDAGSYTFTMKPKMPRDPVPGIIEVGIIVEKNK